MLDIRPILATTPDPFQMLDHRCCPISMLLWMIKHFLASFTHDLRRSIVGFSHLVEVLPNVRLLPGIPTHPFLLSEVGLEPPAHKIILCHVGVNKICGNSVRADTLEGGRYLRGGDR